MVGVGLCVLHPRCYLRNNTIESVSSNRDKRKLYAEHLLMRRASQPLKLYVIVMNVRAANTYRQ